MQRTFQYLRRLLLVFGISLIFITGYYVTLNHNLLLTIKDQRHRCFRLFNNASYLMNFIESKNGTCRLVTHSRWTGRVGNQMFQVASVIGIAHDLDMVPVINLKTLEIAKYFNFPNTLNSVIRNVARCNEKGSFIYSSCLNVYQNATLQNLTIHGYQTSWKYFVRATAYIRNIFQFKPYYMTKARDFIINKTTLGHDNVCIHVRRGDFLQTHEQSVGRAVADTDFLSKAMQFYERKLKMVRFIVLSDDIAWCKHNLNGNVTFSPYKDPGVDLAIMSLCDHVIVTLGTFGWWGAWLSNGTVAYFHGYPRNGSDLYKMFNSDDYYPRNWIKL